MAGTRVSAPLRSSRLRRGRNGDTCQNNWHTGVSNLPRKTAEDGRKNRGVASSGPLLGLDPLQPADRAIDEPRRLLQSKLFVSRDGEEFRVDGSCCGWHGRENETYTPLSISLSIYGIHSSHDRIMLTRVLIEN